MSFVGRLLHSQVRVKVPVPTASFANQTVLITGANNGLGYEASKYVLAHSCHKLILGCRSRARGEAAMARLQQETGRSADSMELWEVDLSSYDSVLRFCSRVNTELNRLDVFLPNAGIMGDVYHRAEDGEAMMIVNVINTFFMSVLLMPKLRETAQRFGVKPRITFISSALHEMAKFPEWKNEGRILSTLNDEKTAKMKDRYPLTKQLVLLVVQHLTSAVLADDTVILNVANPGFCKSDLQKDAGAVFKVFEGLLARTAEEGTRNIIIAAAMGGEGHGKYISDGGLQKVMGFAGCESSKVASRRVWEELKAKYESLAPGSTLAL